MNEVKSPKKPLIYYYMIVVLLVLLFNLLAMPWLAEHQIKEVDYNTFVSMTEKNEIGQVEIQQQSNRILFTSTDGKTIYKTAIVPDDDLVQRLLDAGISTTGEEIEQTSLLTDILGWVLPAGDLYRHRSDHLPQPDEENGRQRLPDVQYGQVRRQDLRQVRRGHQVCRCGRRG